MMVASASVGPVYEAGVEVVARWTTPSLDHTQHKGQAGEHAGHDSCFLSLSGHARETLATPPSPPPPHHRIPPLDPVADGGEPPLLPSRSPYPSPSSSMSPCRSHRQILPLTFLSGLGGGWEGGGGIEARRLKEADREGGGRSGLASCSSTVSDVSPCISGQPPPTVSMKHVKQACAAATPDARH